MDEHFDLSLAERQEAWKYIVEKLEHYYQHTGSYPVSPKLDVNEISGFVQSPDFNKGAHVTSSIDHVLEGLTRYTVHTPHPGYFGLFNPRPSFAGILADLASAVFNPQLAAWSHAPFAVEVEQYLVRQFGLKFGFKEGQIDGVFTTGGAEANLTAMLCALNHHFPGMGKSGLVGFGARPMVYCSAEAHHSIAKAARSTGLGTESVATIATGPDLKMDTEQLRSRIGQDKERGLKPFLLVGTAGSTGAGAIDDLPVLAAIAKEYGLWLHVDAAYGGAAALAPALRHQLRGIEDADSITFDSHKWLSVPMGSGMFITSHTGILDMTFRISTEYMPREAKGLEITDPFTHSIQWSRRFIGLKLYMTLLVHGWEGIAKTIEHQWQVGENFRNLLVENDWQVLNDSPLPILCFTDARYANDPRFCRQIVDNIIRSGRAWLSVYPVGDTPAFRVCITNYRSGAEDLRVLMDELNRERREFLNLEA